MNKGREENLYVCVCVCSTKTRNYWQRVKDRYNLTVRDTGTYRERQTQKQHTRIYIERECVTEWLERYCFNYETKLRISSWSIYQGDFSVWHRWKCPATILWIDPSLVSEMGLMDCPEAVDGLAVLVKKNRVYVFQRIAIPQTDHHDRLRTLSQTLVRSSQRNCSTNHKLVGVEETC